MNAMECTQYCSGKLPIRWLAGRRLALVVVLMLGGLLAAGPGAAETAYVTDMLQLELYDNFELTGGIKRKLRSGDRMEILERRNRKARVRLDDGTTGWVKSLYIVTKEPARTRVNQLETEIEQLRTVVAELRAELQTQQDRVAELEGDETGATQRIAAAEAAAAQARADSDALRQQLGRYNASVPLGWFVAGLVVMLLLGGALGWYWVDSRSRARHGGYRVY